MLSDIHRSMAEDTRTKDLFRDSGGFLALVSTLSGLRSLSDSSGGEGSDDLAGSGVLVTAEVSETQRIECLR